jgi:ATP-binding protein involved in chromosome partitioning
LSRRLGASIPVLGDVPMDLRLREGGDTGIPLVLSDPSAPAAAALRDAARDLSHRRRGLAGLSLDLTPAAH